MPPILQVPLPRHRFSLDDYHRMIETGILTTDDRVELLNGEIVAMPPIGPTHAACVSRLDRILHASVSGLETVRVQCPIALNENSEPEPDLVVVPRKDDDYASGHPTPREVKLLIEVADATLIHDQRVKVPLYAAAGIAEMWLVNLVDKLVGVYRQPAGDHYESVTTYRAQQAVSAIALPDIHIVVQDIVF